MSQAGIIDVEGSHPQIPTSFVTNSGTAIPLANVLEVLGTTVVNQNIPIRTTGSGNTVTVQAQYAISNAISDATKAGFSSFDSTYFTVDANGFVSLGGGGTILETLSDDVGTIVTPISNNIQLAGHVLTGTGSTKFSTVTAGTHLLNINPMTTARWIVDPLGYNGTHTTIQSAINSAVSGETIFIMPGLYIENLTMKSGVNLCAYLCDAQSNASIVNSNVVIEGKITVAGGFICCLSGLRLRTNADFFLVCGGASLTILDNCYLDCSSSVGISSTGAAIYLFSCTGDIGSNASSLFASTGTALFNFYDLNITNTGASSVASTFAGGSLYINNCYLSFPITTSGASLAVITNTSFIQQANATSLTVNGTGGTISDGCYFSSGSSSAISVGAGAALTLSNATVSSTNTNPITGAGTLKYGSVDLTGTGIAVNTTSQTPLNLFLSNISVQKITMQSGLLSKLTTPGAYPYTTLTTDYIILVDSTSARTINLISSPDTGTTYRIKDNGGLAGTNNITISGNGKNIDGSASYIVNTNYGSVDVAYNGTQWNVL